MDQQLINIIMMAATVTEISRFKKKFPHTEQKLKYGIIIPTRNETKVVGNLIDSIPDGSKFTVRELGIYRVSPIFE